MARDKKKVSGRHIRPTAGSGGPAKPFVLSSQVLPGSETSGNRICWRFCHIDHDGPWHVNDLTMAEIARKLASFESMTIHELFSHGEEPGKHYDVEAMPNSKALTRLEQLGLGDMTRVSRLRLGGPLRLYGILLDNVFHILWWDPKHEVWPSKKKNT